MTLGKIFLSTTGLTNKQGPSQRGTMSPNKIFCTFSIGDRVIRGSFEK